MTVLSLPRPRRATAPAAGAIAPVATLFRPASGCGPACLDDDGPVCAPPMRVLRYAALVAVLAVAAVAALGCRLLPSVPRRRAASVLLRRTARALLRTLGIRLRRTGPVPPAGTLVVANHISWLDIAAVLADEGAPRLVAKSEVGSWPVIGGLARLSGTIFIDRARPRTLPDTLAEVRAALVAGDRVVVFAEGTTCCGAHRAPYRPALFQAALDAGSRVVPMALRYGLPDGRPTPQPAFLGDETLASSLRRVVRMRSTYLSVKFGTTLHPERAADRRGLARIAQRAVA